MSGQSDYEAAKRKIVTSGGYAALGSGVRVRISDGVRFVFGFPNEAVGEAGLTRPIVDDEPADVLVLNKTLTCSADAGAAIVEGAWLVGSAGAVFCPVSTNMLQPIIAGNGNEVTLDGLRWTLPA